MTATPEIWLGDLIRAVAAIPGGDDTRRRIAALLGFTGEVPVSTPPIVVSGDESAASLTASLDTAAEWPEEDASVPESAEPDREGDRPANDAVPELLPVDRVRAEMADWAQVPSLPAVTERSLAARPAAASLLAPRSTRAILHALLATMAGDGPIDIPRLIQELAEGRPVSRVPRKPYRTLRFGVQVLVDVGEAMELFARDQEELISRIKSVAGAENVAVSFFGDSPVRGAGPGPRRTWRTYCPPGSGCRILVVSDFGIGGPALHVRRSRPAEWQDFMVQVRRAGCRPVGLIPYPSDRWPAWLRLLLPLLVWDRDTTVGKTVMSVAER